MRIITWNIDFKSSEKKNREKFDYLINHLNPDIAILQECWGFPEFKKDYPNGKLFVKIIGDKRKWGCAIYVKDLEAQEIEEIIGDNVWLIGVEVFLADGSKMLVISVHTKIKGVPHVVPHLRKTFNDLENRLNKYDHFIIAGDFNAARLFDKIYPSKNEDYQHSLFFDELDKKWFNCHKKFHKEEERTLWTNLTKYPYQNDHIYVDKILGEKIIKCDVLPYDDKTKQLSDHLPIIAEFYDD